VSGVSERKATARKRAFARRLAAHAEGHDAVAQARLGQWLAEHAGKVLSGYLPIRTEIDPMPVMSAWSGPVGVPVIAGKGRPLGFHRWVPGCDLVDGPFGARIPASVDPLVPEVLIVPLVAFDRSGGRLGYGGGFYDRTIAELRAGGSVVAVGFAYAAQEDDDLPKEPTDARLDAIVTEADVIDLRD